LRPTANVSVRLCVFLAAALAAGCTLLTSCGYRSQLTESVPTPSGPCGIEFVGVYERRDELVRGLRSAQSINDLSRLVHESSQPGGADILARFRVSRIVADPAHRLRRGDQVNIIFPEPTGPASAAMLPEHLVGQTLKIRLQDPYRPYYRGRFTFAEADSMNLPPSSRSQTTAAP
jgi:hypothetical protein